MLGGTEGVIPSSGIGMEGPKTFSEHFSGGGGVGSVPGGMEIDYCLTDFDAKYLHE